MSETPRSPDNPDNVDARPDVGATETPGDPAMAPQSPPDADPMPDSADDGETGTDVRSDNPLDDATDDEAAAAGGVVLPEYERRLTEASASADTDGIAAIQREYDQARLDRVREANSE